MSRDKQTEIEEMVMVLTESQHAFDRAWKECLHNNAPMPDRENVFYAKYLVEKEGYRKASDVAMEIFEEIDAHFDQRIALYQTMKSRAILVGNEVERKYADTMIINLTIYKKEIAELKKKYIQSEDK